MFYEAWVQRSGTREIFCLLNPGSAALHPGYIIFHKSSIDLSKIKNENNPSIFSSNLYFEMSLLCQML
ncbi:hypothetical protein A6J39_007400 [Legionella anisa]|uniref:Uncharacterized protein n=1 Tax=Legionella anisa TaxID=28082 RepID=A0AAX0WUZ5_9GAMM|nr:hypothetical protein DLD14_14740 [Legionella anisa]PNL61051.1 hypothetical protein A6J39_007400 [Legionella anisa]